jgi:hypothetical protein
MWAWRQHTKQSPDGSAENAVELADLSTDETNSDEIPDLELSDNERTDQITRLDLMNTDSIFTTERGNYDLRLVNATELAAPLHYSVVLGDISGVTEALKGGASINSVEWVGG